jgi:hypothetical protein
MRAEEADEAERRLAKRALFEKMAEEEERNGKDSPGSATSFAALFTEKDMQKAEQTLLALTEQLIEHDPGLLQQTDLESGSQAIKGYRAVVAEHLRHDKARAQAFTAELETLMQGLDGVFRRGLRARVAERELKQVFWDELMAESNPQSAFLDSVFFSIAEKYDKEKTEKANALGDFIKRLSAATGVEERALQDQAKSKRKEAQRLAEAQAGNEDEALQQMVRDAEAPFAQMSRLDFDANDSVVKDLPADALLTDGGAFLRLAADEAEAARLVQEANGFLYSRQREGGRYELKPTIPERAVIHTYAGKQEELALRKNYNRLTRLLAMRLLNADGTAFKEYEDVSDFADNLQEAWNNATTGDPLTEFKNLFKPPLPEELLDEGEDEEAVYREMSLIFSNVLIGETMRGVEAFIKQAQGPLKERADAEYREARQKARRGYLVMYANELKLPEETDAQYEARSEEALTLAENAINDWYTSFEELRALRTLDLNSRDVFLPGACSANAAAVSRMRGYRPETDASSVHVYSTLSETFVAQRRDYICERLSALTGKPPEAFREMPNAALMNAYRPHASFDYHQAPGIGQTEDGAILTLECFAATTAQLSVSPFTRHIYMGVYRDDAGFGNYYNRDATAILTPAERLLEPLRRADLL